MLQGVIFDLDGTLIDTMPVWKAAFKETIEKQGIVYSDDLFREINNGNILDPVIRLKEELQLSASVDEIWEPLVPTFRRLVAEAQIEKKAGAEALLEALTQRNVPFALATSSPRDAAHQMLASVGWQNRFSVVVCGDDVINDKPAPDIFEEAARQLQCDVKTCVVFEDAPRGILSAKSAGMKVVGIADARFGFPLDGADHYITSLDQITINDLNALLS